MEGILDTSLCPYPNVRFFYIHKILSRKSFGNLLEQLVYKGFDTIYQILFFLWQIKPVLKVPKYSVEYCRPAKSILESKQIETIQQ